MTISSSLSASVAGLNANATRMAAISDNIANSATYGYKRAETDFHSLVVASSRGSYTAGGVRTTTQRMVDQRGPLASTTNPTDLAVRGRGMLPVAARNEVRPGEAPQMMLTTTGSFRPDEQGYLTTQSGLVLLGWPANPDGTIPPYSRDSQDGLQPVRLNMNQLAGEPTTRIALGVNLPARESEAGAAGTVQELPVEYYDNLGNARSIHMSFTPTVPAGGASNEWTMTLHDSASGGAVIGEYTLTFDDSRTAGGTLAQVATVSGGAYDAAAGSIVVNTASGPIEIGIGRIGAPDGLTQLAGNFAPLSVSRDGAPVSKLERVEVDANGFVHALFDTGLVRTIYQIPLVDMPNPNGMTALDRQTYLPSHRSGPFYLWNAGDGPTGEVLGYAREESATDVAGELTAMIQTQRAYSSNAKVIQTVDEMLQETANLKR